MQNLKPNETASQILIKETRTDNDLVDKKDEEDSDHDNDIDFWI